MGERGIQVFIGEERKGLTGPFNGPKLGHGKTIVLMFILGHLGPFDGL